MILFFDLETTGTNVAKDRIVQMCFDLRKPDDVHGPVVSRLSWLINPQMPIPAEATAVHRIDDRQVKHEPTFEECAPYILEVLNEAKYICGYNIQNFDIPLLAEELARCGLDWPEHLIVIDLYRSWIKRETRTLADAYERFCESSIREHLLHDATHDVEVTKAVFSAMCGAFTYGETNREALGDLASDSDNGPACDPARYFRKTDDGQVVFAFGKHKDLPAESQRGYLRWMLGSDFPMTTKKFIAQKLGVV